MIGHKFRNSTGFLFMLLLPLLIWIAPVTLTAQENPDDATEEERREMLEDINEEKTALQRELDEMKQAENLVEDDLEYIDRELTTLTRRIERTQSNYVTKQQQVDFFNQSNAQAIADLEAAQSKFELRLIEWYKSGAGSVLGSLLSAGDLSEYIHVMSYMDAIMQSDQVTIDFIREQQGRIAEQTELLTAEIAECERLLTEMRKDEARFQELRGTHYSRLTEIAGDVDRVEKAISDLRSSSYEIAMLLQASQYTSSFSGGGLIPPVDAPITSGFGMRRHPIFGGIRMHTGVDMPIAYGTPIHASQDGVVAFSGWKRGYGNTVLIDHGGGLATLYAHCSSLEVRVGERVSRGQVIAKIGSTGYSTGPHLHFEVRINGEPVDPEHYI